MSQAGANSSSGGGGGSDVQTLTGNTGGAVPPTANNINTLGSGSITIAGNAGTSTLTTQLTGLTNHNVLVGAGTDTITNVDPSTAGFVLTSNGAAADPSFQAVSASGALTTINGDSGSITPTAGVVTIYAHTATNNSGATAKFINSGSTSTLYLTDEYGGGNTFLGALSGNIGAASNNFSNTAVGFSALALTSGDFNCAFGSGTLANATGGSGNFAMGTNALGSLVGGQGNCALGTGAGSAYTTTESNNILLQSLGVIGESNTLRIGRATGTGSSELSTAYISGINGNTVSNEQIVTINSSSDQLGTTTAAGLGAILTITGDTGGAESPLAGNFNLLGSGSITTVGTANTETIQLTGLTNHSVLVGAGTTTITKVAPSATSGVPFISQGAAADPVFGTAVVAGGGTGITSATAYAPIVGGTTTTGPFQSASTGQSTSGFVLTSTGASSVPTFQDISAAGAIKTITGDSGGAQSPSAGNFNILGTGSITTVGTANTETVQLTGLTNHSVLVGAGTATITKVAPSANTGVPLVSAGSSADPAFTGNVDNTVIGANTAAAGTFTLLTATQRIVPSSNTQSLSGTKTLVSTDPQYQFLNPNGSNRTVALPTAATNMLFIIQNTGNAGNVLTVQDASAVQVGNPIANGVTSGYYYTGSSWLVV